MSRTAPLALFLLVLSTAVQANEEEVPPFVGSATLGFLATSGNSDTSSLNGGLSAVWNQTRWRHELTAQAVRASEDSVTSAEAYELGWQSDWDMSDRDFLFGRVTWRQDEFGGFRTQVSETVGYGRRLIETPKHQLNLELGAGARQSEDQLGVSQDETILTGGINYRWALNDKSEFLQTIQVEAGGDNTFSESVSEIKTTIAGRLRLVAGYTIRHNSSVPVGTEQTDTRTSIALEFGF